MTKTDINKYKRSWKQDRQNSRKCCGIVKQSPSKRALTLSTKYKTPLNASLPFATLTANPNCFAMCEPH